MRTLSILAILAALSLAGCPDRAKPPETTAPAPVTPEEAKSQADSLLKDIENL